MSLMALRFFPQHKLLRICAETQDEMNASQNKQYKPDCVPFSTQLCSRSAASL